MPLKSWSRRGTALSPCTNLFNITSNSQQDGVFDNEHSIPKTRQFGQAFLAPQNKSVIHVNGHAHAEGRERNGNREMERSRTRKREGDLRFNECAQLGPCILETICRGLFGTRTRRLQPTKQDSSGAPNQTQLWGNELSWGIVEYQAAFPDPFTHFARVREVGGVRQRETKTRSTDGDFSYCDSRLPKPSYIFKSNIIAEVEDETQLQMTTWSRNSENTSFLSKKTQLITAPLTLTDRFAKVISQSTLCESFWKDHN